MQATARAVAPETKKGRTGIRPSTNLLSNSVVANSTENLRLQRLLLVGIIGRRAELIAGLAWGEVSHG